MMKSITIGSDHGGFELKEHLFNYISSKYTEIDINDSGTYNTESVDYPDIAENVCQKVLNKEFETGILICGTGIGISIKANRYKGIRAALIYDEFTAKMCKEHNNANVICLGGRTTNFTTAKQLVDIWIGSKFSGDRHLKRIEKLDTE